MDESRELVRAIDTQRGLSNLLEVHSTLSEIVIGASNKILIYKLPVCL